MNLLFAQWIFTASIQLTAGAGLEWPFMRAVTVAPPTINELVAIEDIWTPGTICKPEDTACVPTEGGFTAGAMHQLFCVQPGVYVVTLGLGMRPQLPPNYSEATGRIWLASGSERVLVMHWLAMPGAESHQSASVAIAAQSFTCYGLTYDASGTAYVDPATTRLTIHRAG